MKVVLVFPHQTKLEELEGWWYPPPKRRQGRPVLPSLGMLYLCSCIRSNHEAVYIDNSVLRLTDEKLAQLILSHTPDVVGFGGTMQEWPQASGSAAWLKTAEPRIITVYGGPNATARPEKHIHYFDFVFRGMAEYTFKEFLDRIERKQPVEDIAGLCSRTFKALSAPAFIEDLDALPWPDRSRIDLSLYQRKTADLPGPMDVVMTSRGCPFDCRFCSSQFIWNRNYLKRSIDQVVEEIRFMKDRFGSRSIHFREDNLTVDKHRLRVLCEKMAEMGLAWTCQSRVNSLNEEIVRLMKDSGCRLISCGFESINDSTLQYVRKRQTARQVLELIELFERVGMHYTGGFIVATPNESRQEILNTLRFVEKICKLPYSRVPSSALRFVGLPVSELYFQIIKDGLVEYNWQDGELLFPRTYQMTSREIDDLIREHSQNTAVDTSPEKSQEKVPSPCAARTAKAPSSPQRALSASAAADMKELSKPHTVVGARRIFIDGGAYTGNSVQKFISAFEGFEIFSFEPNPYLKAYHEKLPNTLVEAAIWIEDGTIDFFLDRGDYDGSSVFEHKLNIVDKQKITVPSIDFSQWLKAHFNANDLIILKLDIEGAEYRVLDKMIADGTIDYIDELLIEFHWHKIGLDKQVHEDLLRRLQEHHIVPVNWNAIDCQRSWADNRDLLYLKTKYPMLVRRHPAALSVSPKIPVSGQDNVSSLNSSVTVVLRSAGERTEPFCHQQLIKQIAPENIHTIKQAETAEALRETFQIGIRENRKWTLALDANVILTPDAIQKLVSFAEKLKYGVFVIEGLVFDKFLASPRPAGYYLYRTQWLGQAIDYAQSQAETSCPERSVRDKMKEKKFKYAQADFVGGYRDFEQYYKDIYRQCFIYAKTRYNDVVEVLPKWHEMAPKDPDFQIAATAVKEGAQCAQTTITDVDAYIRNKYEEVLQSLHISEKCRLQANSASPQSNAVGGTQPLTMPAKALAAGPLVSVLMSVYNGQSYLQQAMESIYRQTYRHFEFVIIDDGSTDDTPRMLNQLKDERTIIHRNSSNIGLTKSLNLGLRMCRGKYVARMDADDVSLPQRFARQIEWLEAHPEIALVGSAYYRIDAAGKPEARIDVPVDDAAIRVMLREKCAFGHGSVMARREALLACGGYNEKFTYSQDFDLWLRMSERYKLANLAEPLYCWRSTPGCISRSKKDQQRACHNAVLEDARQRAAGSDALACRRPDPSPDKPLVSVIVPTHNRPELLKNAIVSILNQTYPNIEIIVINDGGQPVDGVIAELNQRNNIMSIRFDENKGPAATRNAGLRTARGKYIAYLDDDDLYLPQHIERLVSALEGSNYKVAHSQAHRSHQVKQGDRWVEMERTLPYSGQVTHEELLVRNLVPTLCIMHEKACLEKAGYFDELMPTHQDWDFWIRLSHHYPFLHVPEITAVVRWCPEGSTVTTRNPNNFRLVPQKIYQKYRDWVKDKPEVAARQAERLRQLNTGSADAAPSQGTQLLNTIAQASAPPSGKKLKIAIKSCTKTRTGLWGDMWFAQGLQKALAAYGHDCVIHCRDEWDQPDEEIDVAIHIKGLTSYEPKPHCFNIIWIISHPELHTATEINRFDVVFCGSQRYLDHIKPQLTVPCFYLPQAADDGLFKPLEMAPQQDIDILFVGTNYYADKNRRIIDDVLSIGKEYNLWIVGQFWENCVDPKYIKANYMLPEKLPQLYARARIVLNDHHDTMKEWGFVNDRTYALAAMKVFQISNHVEGLNELGIVTYQTPRDLGEKLDYFLAHEEERQRIAEQVHQQCREFSFHAAAAQILEKIRAHRKPPRPESLQPAATLPAKPAEAAESVPAAPKVSVIMACHNAEPFLAETMDSLLAQTLTEWELLAIDDGSTDGTAAMLRGYAEKDQRVRLWTFKDKRGPYVRRNFAIGHAAADFISIQDADDIMAPRKLEVLYNTIQIDPRLAIVGSFFRRFLETFRGEDFGDQMVKASSHLEIMEAFPKTWHVCWHGSAIIRKTLFETIGLYDEQPYGSDTFWLSKAGLYGFITKKVLFVNIPQYLTFKREHSGSQTGTISPVDPRCRRHKLESYYLYKLSKILEKAKADPALNVEAELKACTCTDFIPRFGSQFAQWESQPVDEAMCRQLIDKAMQQFAAEQYVSCLITLNGLEQMTGGKSRDWRNLNFTRALSAYAAGEDAMACGFLKEEIRVSSHSGAAALLNRIEAGLVPKLAWRRRKEIRDYISTEAMQKRQQHSPAPQSLSDLAGDTQQQYELAEQFLNAAQTPNAWPAPSVTSDK